MSTDKNWKQIVEKIADLSRIAIAPEQGEQYAKEFQNILGFIQQLDAVSVSENQKDFFVNKHLHNVFRSKSQSQVQDKDTLLACSAMKKQDHQVQIPKIM